MSPSPSIFLLQIVAVILITFFHVMAARIALKRLAIRSRRAHRLMLWALVVTILLLDLPMVHLFVVYKDWHPEFLDNLMHKVAAPFVALHAFASVVGGLLLFSQYVIRPFRSLRAWVARRVRSSADGAGAARSLRVVDAGTLVAAAPVGPIAAADSDRRRFLMTAGMALAGCAASATTLRAMGSSDQYTTEQVVIRIPNLPEALKGTTIAMISDIHSSVFMTRDDMERYVKALNGMGADLAIVAGDFVNSKLGEVYPFAEAFSALRAPLGVYGVTGNHDYYTGRIEEVAKEVEACGIKLLRNANIPIEKNGEKLWLLGVDDADIYDVRAYIDNGRTQRGTIENMMSSIPSGAPKVFLCHKPYPFEEYASLGMDLMLSGHTHGGQVVIAQLDHVNLSFATLASRYVAGLYRARTNRAAQLYVSRGVGTVGLPLRLNCPPEVTRIVLV